ncbi:hypothetical protein ABH935_005263 [Catenulispora sp. GAS73]|uniref:hypothetical protein n=1 Tax=Catenulispora sp. GAS73 TaxID=3156269 RepID=UPI003518EDA9
MLLNEPTPHQTRPAAATAAAGPATRDLPAVEVDGRAAPPRASAEADTVAFTAVDAAGAGNGAATSNGARNGVHVDRDADSDEDASADGDARSDGGVNGEVPGPRSSAEAPTVGTEAVDSGSLSTIALDVEAVKRALAEGLEASDATATVSLDVEAVKRATSAAEAEEPTVAFGPVDPSEDEDDLSTLELATDTTDAPKADSELIAAAGTDGEAPATESSLAGSDPADSAAPAADAAASAADADADGETLGAEPPATESSTELVLSADADDTTTTTTTELDLDRTMPTHIATTNLTAPPSSQVAVPETADDVIATIHAAATAVAAADLRARQAAFVKADPWTGLDLHQPPVPAPVDNVLDLLAPVLERPLLVVEQPGLPAAADVVALHRAELAVDFVEPPVVAAGAEPPIPPRYGPGLSVLPHIEFPV